MLRGFINLNIKISNWFDVTFLPVKYRQDGLKDFVNNVVPKYLKEDQKIVDIGGGKRPFVGTEVKKLKGMKIIGLDISPSELKQAPSGVYDKTVVADIGSNQKLKNIKNADIVICEAVLEHVVNTQLAVKNICNILSNQGTALIYVPCKNAPFARLNVILPEKFKKKLLHTLHPKSQHAQGFPAYYHNCTPSRMQQLFLENKIKDTKTFTYQQSNYFSVFFPIHFVWRISQLLKGVLKLDNCEGFTIIATKAN